MDMVLPEFQMVLFVRSHDFLINSIHLASDFTFFCSFLIWFLAEWPNWVINSQILIGNANLRISIFFIVSYLVTLCWERQFFKKCKQTRVCFTGLLLGAVQTSKIRHFRITGWFCSTSNNSECDRRGQTAKFWKWVHQQNLFQATNICCGQEQLKNRKITAFPDSRQLLNTNKKKISVQLSA